MFTSSNGLELEQEHSSMENLFVPLGLLDWAGKILSFLPVHYRLCESPHHAEKRNVH